MLEQYTKQGMFASWLPTAEGGTAGTGTELSKGIVEVKGDHKYLPFVPNGINFVATTGKDVISYNFTGCTMATYVHNGVRKVCHVSTGKGQDCKAEWDRIKGESTNVKEFKPSDYIKTKGLAFAGCYGIITSDDKCYSVTVVRQKDLIVIAHQEQVT